MNRTEVDEKLLKSAAHNDASLCQVLFWWRVLDAGNRPCLGAGLVVGLVLGPGSDLSEEPAVQDVEPVTLDFVSCLIVLPGPPVSSRRDGRRRRGCGRRRLSLIHI